MIYERRAVPHALFERTVFSQKIMGTPPVLDALHRLLIILIWESGPLHHPKPTIFSSFA